MIQPQIENELNSDDQADVLANVDNNILFVRANKYFQKNPKFLTWAKDHHFWFWFISEHWYYTELSDQALTTWMALKRYVNNSRSYVSGYPRSFYRGLPDATGARSRAFRRSISELAHAGLISCPTNHTYELSLAKDFAFRLHAKIQSLNCGVEESEKIE